jgi:hypothetical protein
MRMHATQSPDRERLALRKPDQGRFARSGSRHVGNLVHHGIIAQKRARAA